ncbi:MAG: hypothetical protein FD129_2207 [bacterium]|nr:MAG: hypothetical protein FD129_2207 [bacterium]
MSSRLLSPTLIWSLTALFLLVPLAMAQEDASGAPGSGAEAASGFTFKTREVDLKLVFLAAARQAKANLILHGDVGGTVTVDVTGVEPLGFIEKYAQERGYVVREATLGGPRPGRIILPEAAAAAYDQLSTIDDGEEEAGADSPADFNLDMMRGRLFDLVTQLRKPLGAKIIGTYPGDNWLGVSAKEVQPLRLLHALAHTAGTAVTTKTDETGLVYVVGPAPAGE